MSLVTVALCVVVVTALISYCRWRLSYWDKHGIFCPAPNLFVGHLKEQLNLSVPREIFFDKFYREGKKVIGVYEIHKPALVLNDIDVIQKVLIKDFDHFVDRRSMNTVNEDDMIFKHMLTTTTGSRWKSMRSILTPTFTSGKMKNMFPLVQDIAKGLVKFCEPHSKKGSSIEFMSVLRNVSLDVIGTCAFGLEIDSLNGHNQEFAKAASASNKPSLSLFLKFLILLISPSIAKVLNLKFITKENEYLLDIMKDTVGKRKKGAKRGDFVDLLLEARETEEGAKTDTDTVESMKKKFRLDDNAINAQAFLFLVAGFDTTSNSTSFVLKALGLYPEYQKLIRDELLSKMREDGRDKVSYEDVMEAKWLEAVVAEVLRMYPPTPATERQCTKPYALPDTSFTIPVGMLVGIQIWSLHHDEKFFPEPFKFRPERFLPENKNAIPTGAYMPFGIGPRMCIAQRFALMSMKVAVAELLLAYEVGLAKGYEDMRLSAMPGLLRQAEGTCQLVMKPLA